MEICSLLDVTFGGKGSFGWILSPALDENLPPDPRWLASLGRIPNSGVCTDQLVNRALVTWGLERGVQDICVWQELWGRTSVAQMTRVPSLKCRCLLCHSRFIACFNGASFAFTRTKHAPPPCKSALWNWAIRKTLGSSAKTKLPELCGDHPGMGLLSCMYGQLVHSLVRCFWVWRWIWMAWGVEGCASLLLQTAESKWLSCYGAPIHGALHRVLRGPTQCTSAKHLKLKEILPSTCNFILRLEQTQIRLRNLPRTWPKED